MNFRTIILIAAGSLLWQLAFAAPPRVTNVVAAQRPNTKLVDITYDLDLDQGKTAYVEIWFSHDNGRSFPISANAVDGDVDEGVTGGGNAAVWDAEVDWDQRFTQQGKIRVIATYGDAPSGNDTGNWPGDDNLATLEWKEHWQKSPHGENYNNIATALADDFAVRGGTLGVLKVDPAEITNAQWNEVVEWALANGYDQLPLVPESAGGDVPVTGINYWQAIKWCNARSEKEGLEPAYYVDISEVIGDLNGDGQITNGPDVFQADLHDRNGNWRWDEGEDFHDQAPANGIYEPIEWVDINNSYREWNPGDPETDLNLNAVQEPEEKGIHGLDRGLSQVFRTGASIPGYGKATIDADGEAVWEINSVHNRIKWSAQGYRLPIQEIQAMLAVAGNHKKSWPWGNAGPDASDALFSESGIVITKDPFYADGPLSAAKRGSSPFGLKDMLGNVAEWSEDIFEQETVLTGTVFGGSYMGLSQASSVNPDNGQPGDNFKSEAPANVFQMIIFGKVGESSQAVGLRCVRYK